MKTAFVIMPFGDYGTDSYLENLDVYRTLIRPPLEKLGYETIRADEINRAGSIARDVITYLFEADLVVADLTGGNENVFYELGVRHALSMGSTILITKEQNTAPFNISGYRAIRYSNDPHDLIEFQAAFSHAILSSSPAIPDNPVFDAIGNKIAHYISSHAKQKQQIEKSKNELEISQKRLEELKSILGEKESNIDYLLTKIDAFIVSNQKLIGTISSLSSGQVRSALSKHCPQTFSLRSKPQYVDVPLTGFMRNNYSSLPKFAYGRTDIDVDKIASDFAILKMHDEAFVVDSSTCLMWQQSGTKERLSYNQLHDFYRTMTYGGYRDWRLPTIEEALSIISSNAAEDGVYIDKVFDRKQLVIWTEDRTYGETNAPHVASFKIGKIYSTPYTDSDKYFIRAVRSIKISKDPCLPQEDI